MTVTNLFKCFFIDWYF